MAHQWTDWIACSGIPHPRGVIFAGGYHQRLIGTEFGITNSASVFERRENLFSAHRLANLRFACTCAAVTSQQQMLLVTAEVRVGDVAGIRHPLEQVARD